jgi:hypothetical protein
LAVPSGTSANDDAPSPPQDSRPLTASLMVPSPPAITSRPSAGNGPPNRRAIVSASPRAAVAWTATSQPDARSSFSVSSRRARRRPPAVGLKTTVMRRERNAEDACMSGCSAMVLLKITGRC